MLKWDNVKFYQDKFFRTCIDFYFVNGQKLCEHQPWKPWVSYVLIPARSHLHITKVEKVKLSSYFGLGPESTGVKVMGTLPPWVMKPIEVTNIVFKNEMRREDVLIIDRRLSYSHETHGKPWTTPTMRPVGITPIVQPYLNVL